MSAPQNNEMPRTKRGPNEASPLISVFRVLRETSLMEAKPVAAVAIGIAIACLVAPASAKACTCVAGPEDPAWPTLEQASARSDGVLIGRVLARKTLANPSPYEGRDVAHVDLEIMHNIKGPGVGRTVRVWDAGFGSSCSVDLRPLTIGSLVAMAVARNSPEDREYQDARRLSVAPQDYLLASCGDYMKLVKSLAEATRLAAQLRKAVSAPLPSRGTIR
jgi:hypothetical protein